MTETPTTDGGRDLAKAAVRAVERTDLPRRLKDDVLDTLEERGATAAESEEVAQAVETRYRSTRVDPLDPVGTVSAQSLGEPGTQMSIPPTERVVVRRNGQTRVTEIGPLVDGVLDERDTRSAGEHEVALAPEGLEALSLGADEQTDWKPVDEVSRHEAPAQLLKIALESGRTVTATANHSFVTRRDNNVVPVSGDDLDVGDWLPVVAEYDAGEADAVDLRQFFPAEEYWHTSALTDGGVRPASTEQVENRRAALERGDIDGHAIYPEGGTVGLPEELPLDEETGFFFGAWAAEGSLAEHYVSVSNVDPAFQDRVRQFADRFGLSVNEYENDSGFARGYDVRLNGTILADLLRCVAVEDGEKVVPEFAFGADRTFVRGFLSGYFSGDGNVSDTAVRASSTSDRLIAGVALLLARVGIHAPLGETDSSRTLRVPTKAVGRFAERVGLVGERADQLAELVATVDADSPDATDQIPNFGDAVDEVAAAVGVPSRVFNSATARQRIGRTRLADLVADAAEAGVDSPALDTLREAVEGDVVWSRIESIETVEPDCEYVYDLSVEGLETFTTGEGVVTHNTMNTFHYAGVAEFDVTQGLPRLIELVDARKTPDTPTMWVYLEDEYAQERERAHEVVWQIEATRILALGDISTNVADMVVQIDLNEETLAERWPTVEDTDEVVAEIAGTIESELGVETTVQGTRVTFGPERPSYRELLQLVEELRDIVFKGLEDINRVVIKKEDAPGEDDEEYVLITEGSDFDDVLEIEGVDASRSTCNNIHEIHDTLGIEAAREAIINETMDTLEEQGLDDVNVRHLMLVADMMTNTGDIESIGRHGISGSKESVLARAAFEVTVSHLLDAATYGEVDDLNGVTENVIVGKPIKLGTGDVNLRMSAKLPAGESADD